VTNNRTFFGDNFFEMLCKENNLYYFQNQGKYDSSSKVLKWVDVSVVHATHKKNKRSETRYICKFCAAQLHKGKYGVSGRSSHIFLTVGS
jgi:hypothetical protein